MTVNAPRGTKDIHTKEIVYWQFLEQTCRELFRHYHYQECRTPIFEAIDIFQRGVGEGTDIVQKEMYTFHDKGDRQFALDLKERHLL